MPRDGTDPRRGADRALTPRSLSRTDPGRPLRSPDAAIAALGVKPSPPDDRSPLRAAALRTITAPTAWTPSLRGDGGRAHRRQGQGGPPPPPGTVGMGTPCRTGEGRADIALP